MHRARKEPGRRSERHTDRHTESRGRSRTEDGHKTAKCSRVSSIDPSVTIVSQLDFSERGVLTDGREGELASKRLCSNSRGMSEKYRVGVREKKRQRETADSQRGVDQPPE